MSPSDEQELHRLASMLEAIDDTLELNSPLREALQKAGLALNVGFLRGLRPEIDRQFEELGQPLTDTQRTHLKSLGIEPENS